MYHSTVAIMQYNSFRLHRMREMQSILTDSLGVCLSVCLSRGSSRLHCAKMAEEIKMLFGVSTPGGPWNMEHCVRRGS